LGNGQRRNPWRQEKRFRSRAEGEQGAVPQGRPQRRTRFGRTARSRQVALGEKGGGNPQAAQIPLTASSRNTRTLRTFSLRECSGTGRFMSKRKLVEDMKLNPQRFYRAPTDVIRDRRFSDAERLEILEAWEGMADAGSEELRQAADARKEIEQKRSNGEAADAAKR
jgi:hypothetical protein